LALTKEFLYDRLPGYPSCHGSTIAQRLNGEFISAWFGGPHENHPETVVLFGRKRPQDDEWRDIRAIAGMTVPRPYGNAALFVEPGKDENEEVIWLFFIRSEGRHGSGWCLDCMTYYCRSTDGGWTWSPPRLLKDQWSFLIKNKPLRLRTGELAIPAYSDREDNSVLCVYSDASDEWTFYGPVPTPPERPDTIQATLVAWPDGELQMYFRTSTGFIWRSRSFDDGRTWSVATPTELPNPDSGIDAVTLPDGRLVMVYNPTKKGRTPLWLRVSEDRGNTWGRHLVLEDEPGEYSYPAIIPAQDGLLHITYTHRRERVCHAWLDPDEL
jgi:hypothetical protein